MNFSVEDIKNQLRKKAIIFETGGIMPTNQLGESWIGKVCWQKQGEKQPIGRNGMPMQPLATIFITNIDYAPKPIQNVKLITIFIDESIDSSELYDEYGVRECKKMFKINVYEDLENIEQCNYTSTKIRPFPLVPKCVDNEFPMRDDLDDDMSDLVNSMEEEYGIDYDDDIYEDNSYKHKIGGYPDSIQGGVGYEDGYEFVIQISSDEKAGLNIVDSGNFYFGYNPNSKDWSIRYDFY